MGKVASPASDLFSLGMVVYEMLLGHHPYGTDSFSQVLKHVLQESIQVDASVVGADFSAFLQSLLMKKVTLRMQSAEDALLALCAILDRPMPPETKRIRDSFLQRALFVNREHELESVTVALQNALEGKGGGVLIGGESGIGKSRLIDEIRIHALVDGATVLLGQALAQGNQPLQLWRDILPHLVLEAELSDIEVGILKELVPNIDTLLQRDIKQAAPLAQGNQKRLLDTIVLLFRRIDTPLLIILEDLHWIEDEFSLLKCVASRGEGTQIVDDRHL